MTHPSPEPILRSAELRIVESRHRDEGLMERAGAAAAGAALALAAGSGPVVVIAGPGNNGGDAFVAARLLHERGMPVVTVFAGAPERLPGDAAAAHRALAAAGGSLVGAPPATRAALVIDGLFGIGLARPAAAPYAELIGWINAADAPVLALDVPSGVDADTGGIRGTAVGATATVTFLAWKPGLLTGEGLDCAGRVTLHALGVEVGAGRGVRLAWDALAGALPQPLRRRRRGVHKGTFGTLGIVGGARGMTGAALLAGRGALACGAGKVQVGLLADDAPVVDTGAPELMLRDGSAALDGADALVVGPGLSQSREARDVLAAALSRAVPLVLDADGLNLVASEPVLRDALAARSAPTLLTPHPAEAARLLGVGIADVQHDRLGAAQSLAHALHAHVVVKGAGSVLAHPDGGYAINATGNPALASGGTGDVLAGMLGALLAQGIDAGEALRVGVCVHGAAADALVARGIGPIGLRASELAPAVRDLLNAAAAGA